MNEAHSRRQQSLPVFVREEFRALAMSALGLLGFVAGLVWATIRGSWVDVGWAALFLAIAVLFTAWLRWSWRHPGYD